KRHVLRLVDEQLAHRDRRGRVLAEQREVADVLGREGVFEEEELELVEVLGEADRHDRWAALEYVVQELDVLGQVLAQVLEQLRHYAHVGRELPARLAAARARARAVSREAWDADLGADVAEALVEQLAGILLDLLERVARRMHVHGGGLAHLPADELVDGHVRELAFDVPQRLVDARKRVVQHRSRVPVGARVQRLMDVLDPLRIHADHVRPDELLDRGDDGVGALGERRAAPAVETRVARLHLDDDQLLVALRRGLEHPDVRDLECHGGSLGQEWVGRRVYHALQMRPAPGDAVGLERGEDAAELVGRAVAHVVPSAARSLSRGADHLRRPRTWGPRSWSTPLLGGARISAAGGAGLALERGDLVLAGEHADLQVVLLPLAGLEEAERAAGALVRAAVAATVGGLHPHHVRALAGLLPLPQPRKLLWPLFDVKSEPAAGEAPVDQRGVRPAVRAGPLAVVEDRRYPVFGRSAQRRVVGGLVLPGRVDRLDLPRRRDHLRALVEHREARVDVVSDHMRDRREAQVLDHVVEEQPPLAEPRPDPARQPHVLAVDARLADAPL